MTIRAMLVDARTLPHTGTAQTGAAREALLAPRVQA
jgi:hypothetical protein